MSTAAKRLVTAEELLYLPDDGVRRELVYGEVIERPRAGVPHGTVVPDLVWSLTGSVRQHGLGRVLAGDSGLIDTTVIGLDDNLDGEDVLAGFRCPLRGILVPPAPTPAP